MHVLAMFQLFPHSYLGMAAATDMYHKDSAKVISQDATLLAIVVNLVNFSNICHTVYG